MTARLQKRKRAGLTLIEVMLALAILGIGLSVLVAAAGKCLGVVRKARHYETARRLMAEVERKLQEEMLEMEELEEASEEVSFERPYDSYKGMWEIVRDEDSSQEDEEGGTMFLVRMKVSWSDYGSLNHEEVVSLLYAPEDTEGGSFETTQ